MLDSDLATLYGVTTKAFNQAVKRNRDRFPDDFMFQSIVEETDAIRSQSVTASRRNVRFLPYAFTEHGVAMLSGVLQSPRAVHVNIAIMRAFGRLRAMLATHAELAQRLDELERKYEGQFAVVFAALRDLMGPPVPERKAIGFHARESASRPHTQRRNSPRA